MAEIHWLLHNFFFVRLIDKPTVNHQIEKFIYFSLLMQKRIPSLLFTQHLSISTTIFLSITINYSVIFGSELLQLINEAKQCSRNLDKPIPFKTFHLIAIISGLDL